MHPPPGKNAPPFEAMHPPKIAICTPLGVSINILVLIQIRTVILIE